MQKVIIELEFEGDAATMMRVVSTYMDDGALQEWVDEHDGVAVVSATVRLREVP